MKNKEFSVIIHGGAGKYIAGYPEKKFPGMKLALDAAWDALSSGASGEVAVVEALRVMEESEYFNAGFGGYPNKEGIVLLDVGLMKGSGEFCSLVNVRRLKFPSAIALDMLNAGKITISTWTHDMMLNVDNGPAKTKEHYGLVPSHEDLFSDYVKELIKKREGIEVEAGDENGGTVGCVVRDGDEKLFAGTSTGGTIFKSNGRIGDSPIIGCGVYARDDICAFSTSGHGEGILKTQFANFIIGEIRRKLRASPDAFEKDPNLLQSLIDAELVEHEKRTSGKVAIIVIPKSGAPCYGFDSEMLSVGVRTGSSNKISRDEVCIELNDGTRITE